MTYIPPEYNGIPLDLPHGAILAEPEIGSVLKSSAIAIIATRATFRLTVSRFYLIPREGATCVFVSGDSKPRLA